MGKKPAKKGDIIDRYSSKLVSNISCGALLGAVPFAVLFFLMSNQIFIILAIAVASAGVIADGVVFVKARLDKKRRDKQALIEQRKESQKQQIQEQEDVKTFNKTHQKQATTESQMVAPVSGKDISAPTYSREEGVKTSKTEDCQEA